jgi:hypothetical protein
MAKITDPDNLYYSQYTFGISINPSTALNGAPANMLIDYENKKFALTAPRYGVIGAGSSEMVGYGATGGVSGQALYSKFKNIWKDDPIAVRFPFPMEAITPESFEFINGWLPDDSTVSLQSGINTSFITRKLIKDAGWAERTSAGAIARRYFGTITLGANALGPSGFTTVYYNAVNPGLQTSLTLDSNSISDNRLIFPGVVGNGNIYSSAPYFYTGDAVVYQNDGTQAIAGIVTNGIYYIRYVPNGSVPTGVGHSISFHSTRTDALSGINSVAINTPSVGEVITLTASGTPEDFFFGITEEGSFANEPIQFYSTANDDGSTVLYNRDNYYEIFVREQGKTYSKQSIADIGVNQLNFQAYRFPLTSSTDINITIPDGDGSTSGIATAEYAGIGISFYQTPQAISVAGQTKQFNIVINANQQPLRTVYTKVQYLLRQPIRVNSGIAGADINSLSAVGYNNGTGAENQYLNSFRYGAIQQPLLEFVGDVLQARLVDDIFNLSGTGIGGNNLGNLGVYINNVSADDTNSIKYYDNSGDQLEELFTSTVNLTFNNNLFTDGDGKFWVFYDLPDASNEVIPGLSTSISLDSGTVGTTAGIIGNSFNVGAGVSHPFVTGQKVVAIGQQENPGVGFAMTTLFNPTSLGSDGQGITSYTYYLNVRKNVGISQTYFDVIESGTAPNVIGIGSTTTFRLHNSYSDAIANNYAGINTITLTAQPAVGVVTFRQIDINYSENNATIVRSGNAVGTGVGANEYIDGIDIPSNGNVVFSYDYDSNDQRNRTPATDPQIRIVAVGLQTGQYAFAQASVAKAKGQSVSVTGALERVYSNPS